MPFIQFWTNDSTTNSASQADEQIKRVYLVGVYSTVSGCCGLLHVYNFGLHIASLGTSDATNLWLEFSRNHCQLSIGMDAVFVTVLSSAHMLFSSQSQAATVSSRVVVLLILASPFLSIGSTFSAFLACVEAGSVGGYMKGQQNTSGLISGTISSRREKKAA